jgi:hypothetical protein
MMRKILSALAASAALIAGTLAVAAPASAATPTLRFHGTQYDSPGTDNRSNSSRNAEWISLINSGTKPVNLRGYTVRDKSGHVYTFGSVSIPARGGRIWLHTGKGTNNATHRYWNSGNYIWNNTGDTAYLRNASGRQLDTCSWGTKKNRTYIAC